MNLNPLVSVIMNCHNGEEYLKKSIISLINQTYKNWELIFWNNNSQDKSKQIILSFEDKRIRYFENYNTITLYKARNLAVKKTKGKLVCFLDTDDWWMKNKLDKQINCFNKNKNLNFVYSNYYYYDQKKKKRKLASKKILPKGLITQELLNDYVICILTVMIKKKLFNKFKFNQKYSIIGDFDFFLKQSLNQNIFCLQAPLAYYRQHSTNFSKIKLSLYNKELKLWFKLNKKRYENLKYSLSKIKILYYKNEIKKFLTFFKSLNFLGM